MIVQYFIDWGYVRRRINAVCADHDRLDALRKDLRRLRLGISVNGVLLSSTRGRWTRDLQTAMDELSQDDAQPIREWLDLSNELKSYQNSYVDRRLVLDLDDADSIDAVVSVRNDFLGRANLADQNLPLAIISDVEQVLDTTEGVEIVTLDGYEESATEGIRRSWEHVSFVPGNHLAVQEINRYLAGMSLGATAFGQLTFYDPYCLCVIFRGGSQHVSIVDWDTSVVHFLSFAIGNEYVKRITLVGKDSIVGKNICLSQMRETTQNLMSRRNRRRNQPLKIGFANRHPKADWHNRYADCGIGVCLLPDGMDVFRRNGGGQVEIWRRFEIVVLPQDSQEFSNVREMAPGDNYAVLTSLVRRGGTALDVDVIECAPDVQDVGEFAALSIFPPIVVNLHR